MATVAEQLRRAREDQNLNVYQVAEITKIKTDHIRALESGLWESFSAPVHRDAVLAALATTIAWGPLMRKRISRITARTLPSGSPKA